MTSEARTFTKERWDTVVSSWFTSFSRGVTRASRRVHGDAQRSWRRDGRSCPRATRPSRADERSCRHAVRSCLAAMRRSVTQERSSRHARCLALPDRRTCDDEERTSRHEERMLSTRRTHLARPSASSSRRSACSASPGSYPSPRPEPFLRPWTHAFVSEPCVVRSHQSALHATHGALRFLTDALVMMKSALLVTRNAFVGTRCVVREEGFRRYTDLRVPACDTSPSAPRRASEERGGLPAIDSRQRDRHRHPRIRWERPNRGPPACPFLHRLRGRCSSASTRRRPQRRPSTSMRRGSWFVGQSRPAIGVGEITRHRAVRVF